VAHHTDIHILVRAPLDEYAFAGPGLLRGCAKQHDLPRQIVLDQCSAEGERNSHARNRDEVVPAGMPDPRQGVHFRVEPQCPQGAI